MDDFKVQNLLRECLQALKKLGADKKPQNDSTNLTYKKIKSQLDYTCSGCGKLMDWDNCCITDLDKMKTYHVGCQPKSPKKRKVKTLHQIKQLDTDKKVDLILEMLWDKNKGTIK